MSVAAPGPVGTMSRIGRFGHDWAVAAEAKARETANGEQANNRHAISSSVTI